MRNLTVAKIVFGVALALGCRENTQVSSNDPAPGSAPVKVSRADEPAAKPKSAQRKLPEGKRIEGLESPDTLTLYSVYFSLEQELYNGEEDPPGTERLGGCRVLGKVEIDDAKEREKIVAALQDAAIRPNQWQAKCWEPRHAIVATEADRKFEIVICFKCAGFKLNGSPGTYPVGDQPQVFLNEILTRADVEIAP